MHNTAFTPHFFIAPVCRALRRSAAPRCSVRSLTSRANAPAILTLGDVCVDLVVPVSSFPVTAGGHQNLAGPVRVTPGGACNVAIVASRLGAPVGVVDVWSGGTVDGDERRWRDAVRSALNKNGVDTTGLIETGGKGELSVCVVLVDKNGRHTFVASNERPTAKTGDVKERLPLEILDMIRAARMVTMDGYALDDWPFGWIRSALDTAAEAGTKFWFDPQSATGHLADSNPDLMDFLLKRASALFVNAEELGSLQSLPGLNKGSAAELLRLYPGIEMVVEKLGPKGCKVHSRDEENGLLFDTCSLGDKYVDSTGAGDSLMAGVATGTVQYGMGLAESVTLGCASGSATCMNQGAGENVAQLNQVRACLNRGADPSELDSRVLRVLDKLRDVKPEKAEFAV